MPLATLPLLLILSILATLAVSTACTTNPVRTAQTAEQKGDAIYGIYTIVKEQGAAVLKDEAVPEGVKRPLAEAMVASATPGHALQDAVSAYSADPTASNAQKISAALTAAQPAINLLVAALVKVKPEAQPLATQLEALQ